MSAWHSGCVDVMCVWRITWHWWAALGWWVCDVPHRTSRFTTIHHTHQHSVLVCVLISTGHDIHCRTGWDIYCNTALGFKTDGWQSCDGLAYDMPPDGVMWCGVVWCGVVRWCLFIRRFVLLFSGESLFLNFIFIFIIIYSFSL